MASLIRDELIAQIYAAAVEPDGLATIATLLRRYVDADSAGVWLLDRGQITDIVQTDDLDASISPYLTYYAPMDPWTAAPKTPGFVYLGSDSVDESALIETEFYRDFARHYGMLRPMGLVFDLDRDRKATIALNRIATTRLLSEPDRAVLQDVAIHLRGAFALRMRVLAPTEIGQGRAAALDALTVGVVTCDSNGRVLTANAAAETIGFSEGLRPIEVGKVLRCQKPVEDRALRAAIAAALHGQQGVARVSGVDDVRVSILAVPNGRSASRPGHECALIYLCREDARPGPDQQTLMKLFDLSPAQASLCILLLAGRTFEEAASERGIAVPTARSHFQAALDRTKTRNLRDLLRMLGSFPSIRGQHRNNVVNSS